MKLYDLFADILEYPTPLLSDRMNESILLTALLQRQATDLLNGFKTFLDRSPFSRVEYFYTRTFYPNAICYPYVGYHLFGDTTHRRIFMDGLRELYQICGLSIADELPDHLGIMLRFLAKVEDGDEKEELIFLCILPALKKMLEGFGDEGNPYKGVLQALLLVLQEGQEIRDKKTALEMKEESPCGR
jgi:nitrate reductase molybdenum cofactor assembly chaperone NarJ/NarW